MCNRVAEPLRQSTKFENLYTFYEVVHFCEDWLRQQFPEFLNPLSAFNRSLLNFPFIFNDFYGAKSFHRLYPLILCLCGVEPVHLSFTCRDWCTASSCQCVENNRFDHQIRIKIAYYASSIVVGLLFYPKLISNYAYS